MKLKSFFVVYGILSSKSFQYVCFIYTFFFPQWVSERERRARNRKYLTEFFEKKEIFFSQEVNELAMIIPKTIKQLLH
jgi:hypothetical protein